MRTSYHALGRMGQYRRSGPTGERPPGREAGRAGGGFEPESIEEDPDDPLGRPAVAVGVGDGGESSVEVGPGAERLDRLDDLPAVRADEADGPGLDRLVPFGQALTFNRYWDGYDLLQEFTRRVYLEP